jgi:ABC-2 type transport system permease protein
MTMNGVVFFETLRREWRSTAYWGVACLALGFVAIATVQDSEQFKQISGLLQSMPMIARMFGTDDASFIATIDGFVAFSYFGRMMFLLAVYAVLAGLSVTSSEEERGIMDLHLSLPITRAQLVGERLAAYCLLAVIVITLSHIGALIATQTGPLLREINLVNLTLGSLNFVPITLVMIAFSALCGALLPRRGQAIAAAGGAVAVSYFADLILRGLDNPTLTALQPLSIFYYFDGAAVMQYGLNALNIGILLALVVLGAVGSVWLYQRRDIGV